MLLHILSLCITLACVETLHGIARTVWVLPRLGKERAVKASAITGSLLALVVCYWWVPGLGLNQLLQLMGLGVALAVFMALFDVAMGMLLLRKPLRKVMQDFDPRTGNWLLFGLVALVFMPALAMTLHGWRA